MALPIPNEVLPIIQKHKPFHYTIGVNNDFNRRMFIPIVPPAGRDSSEIWYRQELEIVIGGRDAINADNEVTRSNLGNFRYGDTLDDVLNYLHESGHQLVDLSWL